MLSAHANKIMYFTAIIGPLLPDLKEITEVVVNEGEQFNYTFKAGRAISSCKIKFEKFPETFIMNEDYEIKVSEFNNHGLFFHLPMPLILLE